MKEKIKFIAKVIVVLAAIITIWEFYKDWQERKKQMFYGNDGTMVAKTYSGDLEI